MNKEYLEAFNRIALHTEYDNESSYDGLKFEDDCKLVDEALVELSNIKEQIKSGDLSDGYHTFNQLYYQRCILFASLVRLNKDKSWKSFKHSDGKYCFDRNGEWFIVGIDTPIGSYTYHYEKKYWDLFECQELECGKEWDGHTEEDVTRLLSLPNEQVNVLEIIDEYQVDVWLLKQCDYENYIRIRKEAMVSVGQIVNENGVILEDEITEEYFNLVKRYCDEKNL